MKERSPEEIETLAKEILEDNFFLPSIEERENYFRVHDDNDGDQSQGLEVMFGPDGDAYVSATTPPMTSCRFRVPMIGGGKSHRVRNALLILALAIKLDNEQPQP